MKHIKKFENFLLEYINSDENNLLKYLNMSKKDKLIELVHIIDYIVREFLQYLEDNGEITEEEKIWLYDLIEGYIEGDELVEEFDDETIDKFYNFVENDNDTKSLEDLPSWWYFRDAKLLTNQWLIHLTDYASDIYKDGFVYGNSDMTNLGLTTFHKKDTKKSGGYNFAYTIPDFIKYGRRSRRREHGFRYGQSVILFRASGVKAWHIGDEEYQVIFDGKSAHDIIYLQYDKNDDKWFIESRLSHKILVKKDKIEDIINWVSLHYQKYYKHILNKSNENLKNII